jgi:hypothetical protein
MVLPFWVELGEGLEARGEEGVGGRVVEEEDLGGVLGGAFNTGLECVWGVGMTEHTVPFAAPSPLIFGPRMPIAAGVLSAVTLYACSHNSSWSRPKSTIARVLRTLKGEGACVNASVTSSRIRAFGIGVSFERA